MYSFFFRQQVTTLSHVHQKDLLNIKNILQSFRCQNCTENVTGNTVQAPENTSISFKSVGCIKTPFADKRAVPRQSALSTNLASYIEIDPLVFNNPEHSLDGLEQFSHIWIIYHFNRNANFYKAKIAPPRLLGDKVGIFGTRSPHRPCPIGLSLVQLDKIDGSRIYFSGTDMVDGTPVLDIKPYIPQYDLPKNNDELPQKTQARGEADGEETEGEIPIASTSGTTSSVRVPNWVTNRSNLKVLFNDNAMQQTRELGIDKNSISEILKTDPRSVYLRTRYGSQIYTFQLGENTVTCKFDDKNSTVNVLQVRKVVNLQDMVTDE